ncbi:NEDD8-activating enzyme E1 regulatory subunit-like isoform X2 [Ruditapes philippinarum]|uniref:NEDD8-activating enzyme E1 regulatory subunit-like isoform X2 n=1 Tax=Ruditapes philippinarum TaxID=129788 RepID=UPI00295ABCAC|nr:NEDD8-activating enzyme E1 regulatory subunit-like isoform X2 [Ruditapes philippinarum]
MANYKKSKEGLDKNNKYDRQLRLWGDHGQTALETSRVCLINATATGTEILKNLILPGIGSFTVVDGNKVQGEDVGNNFFLTKESIGQSRAKFATEYLSELNEDVSGDFMEEQPDKMLDTNVDFFNQFTVVIATNLCQRTLLKLGKCLWEKNIPLLVCRCYGFIGYMRLVVKEHTGTGSFLSSNNSLVGVVSIQQDSYVVESHPDNAHEDLRLDRPFDGLVKFIDSIDLSSMSKKDHSHTPWLIVLYKYLQEWKEKHNGEGPKVYREKVQLKDMIREGIRKSDEGVQEDEENFEEAIKAVNTALNPTKIPSEVARLFSDPECLNLHSESSNFWILVRAIKEFADSEGNGALPLRGTIPDMTADSERYIQLQNVYHEQADLDISIVTQRVHDLLQDIGRDEPLDPLSEAWKNLLAGGISEQEIKTFCKNAAFIRVVRCRSLEQEYCDHSDKIKDIGQHLDDEEPDDVVFYILLRAVDRFYEQYNTYPGWYTDHVESDVVKLKNCLSKLLHDWGLSCNIKDDFVHEMCRYGASELHTMASFIGGAAAQEAIKIITQQFVPVNNTYIYNAMKQTSVTVEL